MQRAGDHLAANANCRATHGGFTMATIDERRSTGNLDVPGARLYYEVAGSGPVLLLIPGGAADAGDFARIIGPLSGNYSVITFDPRGISRSRLTEPASPTYLPANWTRCFGLHRAVHSRVATRHGEETKTMTADATRERHATGQDRKAVETLLQQLIDGWNRGSGEGFAAPFAEDGEQVGFDGTHLMGRQQIAEFHQMLFARFLSGTRLVGKVVDVRFLSPDVAVARGIGGTVMPGETDLAHDRNSVQTLVAIKRDGAWRLARLHHSRAEFVGRPEAAAAFTTELRKLL
jgi:uncharacterized protein (TIGR02246 family)